MAKILCVNQNFQTNPCPPIAKLSLWPQPQSKVPPRARTTRTKQETQEPGTPQKSISQVSPTVKQVELRNCAEPGARLPAPFASRAWASWSRERHKTFTSANSGKAELPLAHRSTGPDAMPDTRHGRIPTPTP
jgi:hypothetical protein